MGAAVVCGIGSDPVATAAPPPDLAPVAAPVQGALAKSLGDQWAPGTGTIVRVSPSLRAGAPPKIQVEVSAEAGGTPPPSAFVVPIDAEFDLTAHSGAETVHLSKTTTEASSTTHTFHASFDLERRVWDYTLKVKTRWLHARTLGELTALPAVADDVVVTTETFSVDDVNQKTVHAARRGTRIAATQLVRVSTAPIACPLQRPSATDSCADYQVRWAAAPPPGKSFVGFFVIAPRPPEPSVPGCPSSPGAANDCGALSAGSCQYGYDLNPKCNTTMQCVGRVWTLAHRAEPNCQTPARADRTKDAAGFVGKFTLPATPIAIGVAGQLGENLVEEKTTNGQLRF